MYLGAPAILGALVARRQVNDPPPWYGAASTKLCGGRRPLLCGQSPLVEPGAKVIVIEFTEETWWPSRNTLSECYNNVDVGVPLWLTEPRDKHPRREFVSSYSALYVPHFILAFLCAFTFIE